MKYCKRGCGSLTFHEVCAMCQIQENLARQLGITPFERPDTVLTEKEFNRMLIISEVDND